MSSASRHKAPSHVRYSEGKGRGVFAERQIDAQTVLEISPVLLFTKDEYNAYGKHTVLDQYPLKWPDGRMALAQGLGSLFNHSDHPNVSYTADIETDSIRYTTTRAVAPDEELCIFYGHEQRFENTDGTPPAPSEPGTNEDGWGGLSEIEAEGMVNEGSGKDIFTFADGDPCDVIDEEDLPFERLKLFEDPEEETVDQVQTTKVWVVDLPDPRQTNAVLKWLKQTSFDTPLHSHLKRVRKLPSPPNTTSVLLSPHHDTQPPPPIPVLESPLSEPYVLDVPKTAALTLSSCKVKSSLWPTVYAPRRKGEPELWERGKVRWACDAMRRVVRAAREAEDNGELPIAAYVPIPYFASEDESTADDGLRRDFVASDTRKSLAHPLKHSVINVVRAIADHRASSSSETSDTRGELQKESTLTPGLAPTDALTAAPSRSNGMHYLLTSLTLFTTHEPCIMCSMALLHSRVKEVMYLYPMERTGGCGGAACLPRLEGVNHRFGIGVWKGGNKAKKGVGEEVDA
ncbi:hypothetical protein OE88DRAFT_1379284 [Heliocybe sulcata]|uniref:SET domain-containing protein n=1 Tax=Heliocybe sulcata TaxID=5364 RepID=A0A5C3N5F1_9AGAM|nr:hypothetical protein OE88DRAFT_1379284 [Heliocybe sulcata]